ncbi:MAG: hypothetical protein B7733_17760 [Myxococcales bacterium FL481]|nr:MAG: hypothetical protein B7733_17760 [Myxococcales bacterium FL481]
MTHHGRRRRARPRTRLILGAATLAAVAIESVCVFTDRGIDVERGGNVNRHAVRLVEPIVLRPGEECSCDEPNDGVDCTPACPLPRGPGLPHFLDPGAEEEFYRYCECEFGFYDANYLNPLEFFAEDEDVEPDTDKVFAALLLDWDSSSSSTSSANSHVAYRDLHTGRFILDSAAYDSSVLLRPSPQTRRLVVAGDRGVDLCNAHGTTAEMGQRFHTLTVLVTDRPWYTPPPVQGVGDPPPRIGVPDIAAGATWDRLDYVFYCHDSSDESCQEQCVEEQ